MNRDELIDMAVREAIKRRNIYLPHAFLWPTLIHATVLLNWSILSRAEENTGGLG
jgi:hypothetical protein